MVYQFRFVILSEKNMHWIAGLAFSLVVGHLVTSHFLSLLRKKLELDSLPKGRRRISPSLTGAIERLFFTVLIGFDMSGASAAMIAWLALKLATNWNHLDWKGNPDARTRALSALLAGLVSMLFALIGGVICASK